MTLSNRLLHIVVIGLSFSAIGGAWAPRSPLADYSKKLEEPVAWPSFPLRVFFIRDAQYSEERERLAVAGFRQWETATGGVMALTMVDRASEAEIRVGFDPETSDGATTNSYSRGELIIAKMKIGTKRGRPADITCIAAHEFGHALGLNGHSDSKDDLMYPYRWSGKSCGISARDLNTLATRYPGIRFRIRI